MTFPLTPTLRLQWTGFENPLPGQNISRFSLVLLQQNDHYGTGNYENFTAVISFRGQVVELELPVGVHTLWWHAATSAGAKGKVLVADDGQRNSSAESGGKKEANSKQERSQIPLDGHRHHHPGAGARRDRFKLSLFN
jgi:hypothetical protein